MLLMIKLMKSMFYENMIYDINRFSQTGKRPNPTDNAP